MPDVPDRISSALAGRYTLERELGRGGMATVWLAHDLKHDRPVALKILRPELAAALGPERFLREITTTANLRHPHILPLYDSGHVTLSQPGAVEHAAGSVGDEVLYYVMPYVEGESLRDRLAREKQLPLEDALQIAREVADALSYAHSHGVMHRDIKPENILLESGHAVVADFGIARAITAAGGSRFTETGMVLGTPAYMSPEQSTGEPDLDGRSDLYSLGCVLYEMLVGEPPFTGPTAQAIFARRLTEPLPRVSVVRDAVPPGVEEALRKALARAPADRFVTAEQFARALSADRSTAATRGRAGRRRRVPRALAIAGLVVVALGVVGGLHLLSSSGIDFAARDWILVTRFDNRTGDSVFDGSLGAALTVGLQQSRYVNVLPPAQVDAVLAQMELAKTTPLTETVGREVALRANIHVLVVPTISRIDSTYLLTTRIVDPQTGTDLLTRSARAHGKAEVLSALDDLVRRLRRDLGESRRAVAQNGLRLDRATTASLEALRSWTEGNAYWNTRRYDAAAERYRAALRLDSTFAMAHKTLGQWFAMQGLQDSSEHEFAQALAALDRVTERERLLIQATLYGARSNWSAAIRTQETYVERYPDDWSQRFNLGTAYMRADRYADAIRTLREVVQIDSMEPGAFVNLATTYARMDSCAAAVREYRRAFALRPGYRVSGNLNHEFGFDLICLGQLDSAEATFTAMQSENLEGQAQGQRSLGLMRTYQGRYVDALPHFERAVALTRAAGAPLSEFRNDLFLGMARATAGRKRLARAAVDAAAAIADTVSFSSSWLARLAAGYARLGDTLQVKRWLPVIEQGRSPGSPVDEAAALGTAGRLALARGRYARAIDLLQRAVLAPAYGGYEYRMPLARAYRLNHDADHAVSAYRELLGNRRSAGWEPQEDWILARYELGTLYQEQGDTARAVEAYRKFLDFWRDADADLSPVVDAHKRLEALTSLPES